ncbi:MAG: putative dehydrogenase [Planctomycetota bacterium]|jgi:predicted dehydrogenase
MHRSNRRSVLKASAGGALALSLQPHLFAGPVRLSAPVKLGLVGAGRQGRAILAELAKFPDVTMAAVCDLDDRRLKSSKRRAKGANFYASLAAMLEGEKDLDGVLVATPSHLHRAPAEEALAAGKHVYCEAPLATTLEDARAIAKAARSSGSVFQTGLLGRANPVYTLARTFVKAGAIRDVISMRAQHRVKNSWVIPASEPERQKRLNWRLDPELSLGLIGELGIHQFDVMHWYTGQYPTSVRATGSVQAWKDGRTVADTVHAQLTFPKGVQLAWEGTLGNTYGEVHEELLGTMGSVRLAWSHGWMFKEADAATQGWEVYANRQQFHNDEGITLIADATKLASQGKLTDGVGLEHPALYYGMETFLKSITEEANVVCGADEGLRAAAVAIQTHKALISGEEVLIGEDILKTE